MTTWQITGLDITTHPLAQAISLVSGKRKLSITRPFGEYYFPSPRDYLNCKINTDYYIPFCQENPFTLFTIFILQSFINSKLSDKLAPEGRKMTNVASSWW